MPYEFYKVLHVVSVIALMLAFGGMLALPDNPKDHPFFKRLVIAHGVALLLILVAGFGLLAKLGIHSPWPTWIWVKLGIWLVLGAYMAIIKRFLGQRRARIAVSVFILGSLAAYMGIYKGF